MPPSTPVNISIDVVDHLGQCLANVPNTLKVIIYSCELYCLIYGECFVVSE